MEQLKSCRDFTLLFFPHFFFPKSTVKVFLPHESLSSSWKSVSCNAIEWSEWWFVRGKWWVRNKFYFSFTCWYVSFVDVEREQSGGRGGGEVKGKVLLTTFWVSSSPIRVCESLLSFSRVFLSLSFPRVSLSLSSTLLLSRELGSLVSWVEPRLFSILCVLCMIQPVWSSWREAGKKLLQESDS